MHERRERAQEAAPDASGEPEVQPVADHARQEHVHEPLVRCFQERIEDGIDRVPVREDPSHDADHQNEDGEEQHSLSQHVRAVPEGAVRHLVPVGVSQGLGERAAGADPPAVHPFPEEVDPERDEHQGLEHADADPPPQRIVGEDVVDVERPRQDEAVRAPELPPMPVGHHREEGVQESLREHLVIGELRKDDLREEKERKHLNRHQRRRLERDVGGLPSQNSPESEHHHDRRVGERVPERGTGCADRDRADQALGAPGVGRDAPSDPAQEVGEVEGKPVTVREELRHGAA